MSSQLIKNPRIKNICETPLNPQEGKLLLEQASDHDYGKNFICVKRMAKDVYLLDAEQNSFEKFPF